MSLKEIQKEWHGSLKAYIFGFFASLFLTLASFSLAAFQWISGRTLLYTIVGLGLIQAIVQLRFFLHLGQEPKPRWESLIFYFMILMVLIIGLGTLWVMNDLNERLMKGMHD